MDEVSGEAKGVENVDGDLSDSSPEWEEADEELLGKISGALYESMFVVEMSSTGAEILCLIVPENECFVVIDRFGIPEVASAEPLVLRLVVKALESDIFAE